MLNKTLRGRLLFCLLSFALALAASCRDSGKGGEYFVLDGKLFVFNYRVATATYLVNIKAVKPVGEGQVAVVSFEDPAGGAAIVVREKIWPATSKTTINSPPITNIQRNGSTAAAKWCTTMNTRVPASAPHRRPVPPSTSITSTSAECAKPRLVRPTTCVICAESAPATPASAPPMA